MAGLVLKEPAMKRMLAVVLLTGLVGSGCAMFTSWKSIPPPGGCDQCHTVNISAEWKVSYQAPMLTDERNRNYFQTAEYTMTQPPKPDSKLDLRKVEELQCFECHKSPTAA